MRRGGGVPGIDYIDSTVAVRVDVVEADDLLNQATGTRHGYEVWADDAITGNNVLTAQILSNVVSVYAQGGVTRESGQVGFAWDDVWANNVQPASGAALTLSRQDGTVWATTSTGTGSTSIGINTDVLDNVRLHFGNAGDVLFEWDTSQTNDALLLATNVGTAAQSGNIIITAAASAGTDHAFATSADPRVYVCSTTTPGTNWLSFFHNGVGNIVTGSGGITMSPASNVVTIDNLLQAPSGTGLGIRRQDGTAWATLSATTTDTRIGINTGFGDNIELTFGLGNDCTIGWETAQANDGLVLSTTVGSASGSGNIIITTAANSATDHGLGTSADPRLYLFSASGSPANEWISFHHDATSAVITSGAGGVSMPEFLNVGTPGGAAANQGGLAAGLSTRYMRYQETVNVFNLINTNNTAGQNAKYLAQVGGASAGDPQVQFTVSGATDWSIGIDNTASDAWVLSNAATLGSNNAISVAATTQTVTIVQELNIGTAGEASTQADLSVGLSGAARLLWDQSVPMLRLRDSSGNIFAQIISLSGDVTVFNESQIDVDFRIEGDTAAYMFFLEANAASENIALLTTAAPTWNSMDRGLFLGDVTTAPTAAATAGAFLWSAAGVVTIGSDGQNWAYDDANATVTSTSESAGNLGPIHVWYHNSASPLAADVIGRLRFDGEDLTPAQVTYAQIDAVITTAGASTYDGELHFKVASGGSLVDPLRLEQDNISLFAGAGSYGGGVDVLFVGDATTVPTSNPTGGGVLYSESGAGTWRGSGGTTTVFAESDPVCESCGRDFGWKWTNDGTTIRHRGGRLAICAWCLIAVLEAHGVDVSSCVAERSEF